MEDYFNYVDIIFQGKLYQFEEVRARVLFPDAWDPLDRMDLGWEKVLVDGSPKQEPEREAIQELAENVFSRIQEAEESANEGQNYHLF